MSKNKKRHSQSSANAKRLAREEELADFKARDKNRLKPVARNLLLGDLVMLAATQLLVSQELIGNLVANALTILGVILLLIALYIQFSGGPKNHHTL